MTRHQFPSNGGLSEFRAELIAFCVDLMREIRVKSGRLRALVKSERIENLFRRRARGFGEENAFDVDVT